MRLRTAMAVAFFGLVLGASGDTHESLMDEQFDLMEEILDIMDDVDDKESAQEAAEEIKALTGKMVDLQKRMAKMPSPTAEQAKELQAMLTARAKENQNRGQDVGAKMMNHPELMEAFAKAMQSMGK